MVCLRSGVSKIAGFRPSYWVSRRRGLAVTAAGAAGFGLCGVSPPSFVSLWVKEGFSSYHFVLSICYLNSCLS